MQIEIDCNETRRVPLTDGDRARGRWAIFNFHDAKDNVMRINLTDQSALQLLELLMGVTKERAGLIPEDIKRQMERLKAG
jgi:hypothetical protein